MLTQIHPKLPMRDKNETLNFYSKLGFKEIGAPGFDAYLMIQKDQIEIHFFKFERLKPHDNYGQVYIRTDNIQDLYQKLIEAHVTIHPNGPLQIKPWGQLEFSILDPDNNLITFGEKINY